MNEMGDSPAFCDPVDAPFADPVSPTAAAINEDLYCFGCGYNLRGLSGDPVRCPECGQFNDRTELGIPQPVIQAALKQMETAPTVCVGWALLFVLFAILTVVTLRAGSPDLALVFSGLSLACIVAWPITQDRVRRSFNDHGEWRAMLAEFHAAGVLGILWYPMLLAFVMVADRSPVPIPGVLGGIVAALGVASFVIALRIYRTARGRIRAMKRTAAVRLAQEILGRATLPGRPTNG